MPVALSAHHHVVQVAPGLDALVDRMLDLYRFEHHTFFHPCARRKKTTILVPSFPGYRFVKFDVETDGWRAIPQMPGVLRLFSSSPERPAPIADDTFARLVAFHQELNAPRQTESPFRRGEEVTITSGPFEGGHAIYWRDGTKLVELLITIFGHSSRMKLPKELIMKKAA